MSIKQPGLKPIKKAMKERWEKAKWTPCVDSSDFVKATAVWVNVTTVGGRKIYTPFGIGCKSHNKEQKIPFDDIFDNGIKHTIGARRGFHRHKGYFTIKSMELADVY